MTKKEREEKLESEEQSIQAPEAHDETLEIRKADHDELVAEIAEFKDKYIRLVAEFENVRKRNERERIEFIKYANEGLIAQFLNILDDLERSVEAAKQNHQDYTAFLKGIEMVMAHVYDMLKRNDVKPMESVGKKFDPHCHEPLMQVESDEQEDGTVVEEFQKGYLLGDRVVRTSKVKVAKPRTDTPLGQPAADKVTEEPPPK